MKRRYILLFLVVTLLLVALDQGTKLWASQNGPMTEHPTVEMGAYHVHPHLNDAASREMAPIAEALSLDVRWVLLGRAIGMTAARVFALLILIGTPYYFLWDVPRGRKHRGLWVALNVTALALSTAADICSSWLDQLLWGGSLDWIGRVRHIEQLETLPGHTHGGTAYHCSILDIKDLYVYIILLLTAAYLAVAILTLLRQPREVRARYDDKSKHPMRNLRAMWAHHRAAGERSP